MNICLFWFFCFGKKKQTLRSHDYKHLQCFSVFFLLNYTPHSVVSLANNFFFFVLSLSIHLNMSCCTIFPLALILVHRVVQKGWNVNMLCLVFSWTWVFQHISLSILVVFGRFLQFVDKMTTNRICSFPCFKLVSQQRNKFKK